MHILLLYKTEGRAMNERRGYKHKERCWRERIERSTNNKWNKVELRQRVLFKVFMVGRWVAPPARPRQCVWRDRRLRAYLRNC